MQRLNRFLKRLENVIIGACDSHNYELALEAISSYAFLSYESNQFFYSEFLEKKTEEIAQNSIPIIQLNEETDQETVLFYDGFGEDTRGLALIYLKGLASLKKKIIYITHTGAINRQPEIMNAMQHCEFECYYLSFEEPFILQAQKISKIVEKHKPRNVFIYTLPYDVSAVAAFERVEGPRRIKINLTDHTFWLGTKGLDVCLEFRDYGYIVSNKYRRIEHEKQGVLPYYPNINMDTVFAGYPFETENKRIIFSGGDLNKTLGKDDSYYSIIDHILANHSDIVFWYAGFGDASKLMQLRNKYSDRVFFTSERPDLYRILERCCLYLNTYPIAGGLMTQYAAAAGVLPITLLKNEISGGSLLNQDQLGVFYYSKDELLEDVDKLLEDPAYLHDKERKLGESLISEAQFNQELGDVLCGKLKRIVFQDREMDFSEIRSDYAARMNRRVYEKTIIRRRTKKLYRYFPDLLFSRLIFILKTRLSHKQ